MKATFWYWFIAIVAVLAVVIGGMVYYRSLTRETNGEMLSSKEAVSVSVETVAYYPGALGYYARPEGEGRYSGVVMIHENTGLNDGVRAMARELAGRGYQVLAVDLFGKSVETQDEARALTAALDQNKATENMRVAAKFLRDRGAEKIASLGWCFGGAQSLLLALSGEKMDATVIYYGRLVSDENRLAAIKWPVLGIFGDKDAVIPVDDIKKFDATLDKLGIENEIYIYPGVGHAFANPSRPSYAPAETKDAWEKTLVFLKKNL